MLSIKHQNLKKNLSVCIITGHILKLKKIKLNPKGPYPDFFSISSLSLHTYFFLSKQISFGRIIVTFNPLNVYYLYPALFSNIKAKEEKAPLSKGSKLFAQEQFMDTFFCGT